MRTVGNPLRLSRQFSTASQKSPLQDPATATAHSVAALFGQIIDKWPDIKTVRKVHSKIIFDPNLSSSISFGIKLMRAYAACGHTRVTRQIFDNIPERNVVIFNVMIRGYVNNQLYDGALFLFKSMNSSGTKPDYYTFPCLLKACSLSHNLRVGLQIHTQVLRMNLETNIYVGNGLIAMYGKCGSLVDARRVLDNMPSRDVVTWNSMISGFAQNGGFHDALGACREMKSMGVKPDAGTMASLLPAVTNTSPENVAFVEDTFVKVKNKELIPWNVMIAMYLHNSMPNKAVELYLEMENCGIEPNAITIATVLPACGDLSAIMIGRRVHKYAMSEGIQPNLPVENALIDMYAKCGCLQEAREVFDRMQLKDVVSWTSMITAYGKSGEGANAVSLFSEMRKSLTPDSVAFVSILSACSHAGLLEQGQYFYNIMIEEYKIMPRLEHFSCMVDLLGRAGKVREAYDFIKDMPMEPNETIWGCFLSACRVHNDMDTALEAADQLFQMAPNQSGYYVLLSNIYAKAGKWKKVTSIREIMKGRGIKKLPGVSNVELNNQVHTFLAGDRSHPQSKKIYEELDILLIKMKELGYVPERDDALHDVEEEDKENHLVVHSEKLAIVFAIINTKPRTQITITKNLRVCGDCHSAAKFISKITEREIMVRDINRFHHFENGFCSCGDYW